MLNVIVNGRAFNGFSEVSMIDDVTQLCNQFKLTCSSSDEDYFPIYRDSEVLIYNGDTLLMTGVVEIINGSYSFDDYSITVSGRDVTRNILKNDIPPNLKFRGPISLESVIKKTLKKLNVNLSVTNTVSDLENFTDRELLTTDIGDSVWDFWTKLSQKLQVLISKDEYGNLLILRPQSERYTSSLNMRRNDDENTNNIIKGSWTFDDTERRYEYNVYSQSNVSIKRDESPPDDDEIWEPKDTEYTDASYFLDTGKTEDDRKQELFAQLNLLEPGSKEYASIVEELGLDLDTLGLSSGRVYTTKRTQTSGRAIDTNSLPGSSHHKVSDDPADDAECLRQAKWQANQARVKAVQYQCTVQNLTIDNDVWRSGRLINVYDEIAQLQALMLITRVEYNTQVSASGDADETVSLTLTLPDAYTDKAEATERQNDINIIGQKWNNGDFQ